MRALPALLLALASTLPAAGMAEDRPDRRPGVERELAQCRVRHGHPGAPGETSALSGTMSVGACARAIQAGSGTGRWGVHEVEVDAEGHVRVNGESIGILRNLGAPDEEQHRG